ncbi:unnamed protein product [Leptosia nina]|uniref:BTB domain-containing protein n=1 Tax=Leptosia nina TaxID=320188 RepID=A0AAV1JR40_9NEOP
MEKDYIKSTVEGLKCSSSSRIQDSLMKIRLSIITSEKGIKAFRECGGLEYLLPHLRKPNERILDLTLSILGNVCLDEKCRLAVGKLNTFGPLVSILNTVSKDSILGRTCKLIGNLAQTKTNAEGLYNRGVISALVSLIEGRTKSTSNPTLMMAVRAIRQLWTITDKRDEMLSMSVVRCIAILLTTECESIGLIKSTTLDRIIIEPSKSQEELIVGILKCLGHFTTYSTSKCAKQLQGDGRGYQCLVALTKTNEILALKCLMNLCYLSACRPLLGTAGLVECLVNILQRHAEVKCWPDGAAKALAQLSGESVNRSRLRHCGGLPLLVAAARVNSHAMHALVQYVFDNRAFQILIDEGLITLLTDKLSNYVKTMEVEHNLLSEGKFAKKTEKNAENEKGDQLGIDIQENLAAETEDDLKVVIERDNMLIGLVDAIGSDKSDSDVDATDSVSLFKQECLKRAFTNERNTKKKSMVNKHWQPESPELLSPYSDGNWSGLSPEYNSKRSAWDWSPASSSTDGSSTSPYRNDSYPWSPSSSSGPASPLSIEENSSDSEVSGRYSPVCSDSEDEGSKPKKSAVDPAQVAHELEELIMEDEESSSEWPNEENEELSNITKPSGVMCILVILYRVSFGIPMQANNNEEVSPNLELLAGSKCMNALLDYVEKCRRPTGRAARIINRVLTNSLCLISLLKHKLPVRIHNMSVKTEHPPTDCRQCKQLLRLGAKFLEHLTVVAESSHGIGEISYHLLKGSEDVKQTLALTLPYLIRSEKILKKYFVDCEALNLPFSMISDSIDNIELCVPALIKLVAQVQIKDPKIVESRYASYVPIHYESITLDFSQDDIVTFVLDDNSTVKASRNFLCQHSDVFKVMLTGSFKESSEKYIRLKTVSQPALECLFTLLYCYFKDSKCDAIKTFPLSENLDTNLEVLLLADRFLFDRIKTLLSSAIIQFQFTPDTVVKIYVWSLGDGVGYLCVEAVAYLLTGEMSEESRLKAFKNIVELDYKEQWLEDVRTMILRQLLVKWKM